MIKDTAGIECPCCEHTSEKRKWDELRGDDFLICPVCDNTCEPHEFKEGLFN